MPHGCICHELSHTYFIWLHSSLCKIHNLVKVIFLPCTDGIYISLPVNFSSISFCFHAILSVRVDTQSSILQSILVSMSRPICVQGVGQVACPAYGQLFSARGGISLHYHNSPQCLPTASAAVGICCQERRSNVGNIASL